MTKAFALLGFAGLMFAGTAVAEEIFVGDCGQCTIPKLIDESTTFTADNTYNLTEQIYVLPGASLTIEAGTIVASTPSDNGSGSLAICNGAQIFVMGEADAPVIMTSKNDDFVTWREACNEWGNLTIMGDAYISEDATPGNTMTCDADNYAVMEGLIGADDPKNWYGGGNDDDDSGEIHYMSVRYGGRVVELANELNGLSLGGLGRETDIDHVEIMNNVDDGIEIWGGTVCIKYATVWNIGDDSFDIDQGHRGKHQNILIVQGYSVDDSQGSGVGDNCFETDGAEDSNYQPVTTTVIYNATAIGQPFEGAGDGGTVWRDNARVQYRNCIFTDLGEKLVRFDNIDGDGAHGYGYDCTLTWLETWDTPWTFSYDQNCNDCDNPEEIYQSQFDGYLCEIRDSVFYNNNNNAYADATTVGVFEDEMQNVLTDEPVLHGITRLVDDVDNDGQPGVTKGGKIMLQVIELDPLAINDAAWSYGMAPDDGFFTPQAYRGAFEPFTGPATVNDNWLIGWTAADAYGFIVAPPCWGDVNDSGEVDIDDLFFVLAFWGDCDDPNDCPADANLDGTVDIDDVFTVLGNWGACP